MQVIVNNPFRVLGIYANATTKELVAMKSQMRAYAKIGQTPDLPLRLVGLLPRVAFDDAAIARAESELALACDRRRWAMFWFERGDATADDEFIRLIGQRAFKAALALIDGRTDPAALKNRMVLSLVQEDWREAVKCAELLYQDADDIRAWIDAVTRHGDVSMSDLYRICAEGGRWRELLYNMLVGARLAAIDAMVVEAEAVIFDNDKHWTEKERMGRRLLSLPNEVFLLRNVVGRDNVVYQVQAERVAKFLLRAVKRTIMTIIVGKATEPDYYSNAFGNSMALQLLEYAEMLAVEEATREEIVELAYQLQKAENKEKSTLSGTNKSSGCLGSLFEVIGYLVVIVVFAFLQRACGCSSSKDSMRQKYTTPSSIYNKYEFDKAQKEAVDKAIQKAIRESLKKQYKYPETPTIHDLPKVQTESTVDISTQTEVE